MLRQDSGEETSEQRQRAQRKESDGWSGLGGGVAETRVDTHREGEIDRQSEGGKDAKRWHGKADEEPEGPKDLDEPEGPLETRKSAHAGNEVDDLRSTTKIHGRTAQHDDGEHQGKEDRNSTHEPRRYCSDPWMPWMPENHGATRRVDSSP